MSRVLGKLALQRLESLRRDEGGAAAVEVALLSGIFVAVLGGGVEMGLAYHQKSTAEIAARHGARLAATNAPVAPWLNTFTGMGGGVRAGDPMPDYVVTCDGASRSCSQGSFSNVAITTLVEGSTGLACDAADRRATTRASDGRSGQGMCDFLPGLAISNVNVRYEGSGLGTAGNPADPLPLVTVTVTGLEYDFIILDRLLPGLRQMDDVSATVMAEDLRGGA